MLISGAWLLWELRNFSGAENRPQSVNVFFRRRLSVRLRAVRWDRERRRSGWCDCFHRRRPGNGRPPRHAGSRRQRRSSKRKLIAMRVQPTPELRPSAWRHDGSDRRVGWKQESSFRREKGNTKGSSSLAPPKDTNQTLVLPS